MARFKKRNYFSGGCSNSAYDHHESYSLCIRVSTDQTDWHSARANCQADGADLVMVKDAGFKVYLQDNVLTSRSLNDPFMRKIQRA